MFCSQCAASARFKHPSTFQVGLRAWPQGGILTEKWWIMTTFIVLFDFFRAQRIRKRRKGGSCREMNIETSNAIYFYPFQLYVQVFMHCTAWNDHKRQGLILFEIFFFFSKSLTYFSELCSINQFAPSSGGPEPEFTKNCRALISNLTA